MSAIDIVLASYNGEKHIEEQIESIQKNHDYSKLISRFIIVDDGSSDTTQSIVNRISKIDPKIELHINPSPRLGPHKNFEFGIGLTTAEYIMLSDQDDIWLKDKIRNSFDKINMPDVLASSQPAAVFTDLKIVDEKLNEISKSYFKHKNIPKSWCKDFGNLVQQNSASGCTMLFNRKLVSVALPFPEDIYMHDWWLSLVAKKFGSLSFLDQSLVLYRQHDNNSIGAKSLSFSSFTKDLIKNLRSFEESFNSICLQAKDFYSTYSVDLKIDNEEEEVDKALYILAHWPNLTRRYKIKALWNRKIRRSNVISNFLLLLIIMFR